MPFRGLRLLTWFAAGVVGITVLAGLRAWVPPEDPRLSVCVLRNAAGLPCPGCGLTRAFAHLAKGEWSAAWKDHPLAFPLAVEALWVAWGGLALSARGNHRVRRIAEDPRVVPVLLGHAAVLTAFWIGRLATGTLPW